MKQRGKQLLRMGSVSIAQRVNGNDFVFACSLSKDTLKCLYIHSSTTPGEPFGMSMVIATAVVNFSQSLIYVFRP